MHQAISIACDDDDIDASTMADFAGRHAPSRRERSRIAYGTLFGPVKYSMASLRMPAETPEDLR